jgi:hypothetical protein
MNATPAGAARAEETLQFTPGLAPVLATLSTVLLLPLGLTLLFRNKALRASTDDRAAVWFSFVRFLRWQMVGTLALWWAATDLVTVHRYLNPLSFTNGRSSTLGGNILSLFLLWLAPDDCSRCLSGARAAHLLRSARNRMDSRRSGAPGYTEPGRHPHSHPFCGRGISLPLA